MQKNIRFKVSISECYFRLKINGFIFFNSFDETNMNFGIPLNEWVKEGENNIIVELIAANDEKFNWENIRVSCYMDNIENLIYVIDSPLAYVYKKSDIGLKSIVLKYQFTVKNKNNQNLYSNLTSIPDVSKSVLYLKYKNLVDFFRTKNKEGYSKFLETKIKDFAFAYDMLEKDEFNRQLAFFDKLSNLNFTIKNENQLKVLISDNNKLVCLVDNRNEDPIVFVDNENEESFTFPMWFGIIKGENDFKIIR